MESVETSDCRIPLSPGHLAALTKSVPTDKLGLCCVQPMQGASEAAEGHWSAVLDLWVRKQNERITTSPRAGQWSKLAEALRMLPVSH